VLGRARLHVEPSRRRPQRARQQGRGVAAGAPGCSTTDGPGKAVDTNHSFVVSVNALGSHMAAPGPTAPIRALASLTDRPSRHHHAHIVAAEKLLVDSLGLKSLVAVIGPSMGGFQSFQWAASYPAS